MDVDDITAAIAAGDLDGQLEPIVAAAVARVREGAVEMRWRIRFDGDEWTEDSVTLGELKFAEQHCHVDAYNDRGLPYRRRATRVEIDPRVHAEHALALIIARLTKVDRVGLAEATKRAEAITAADLAGIVGEYEVVRPKDAGSPESTTS